MDPQEFVETVRDENKTALSRLGSSKALYADTEGEMETDAVVAAAYGRAVHAADTLESWADDEVDTDTADLFAETAATERDHAETIAAEGSDPAAGDPPAVQARLREVEGTVERLGAFVGWALAAANNTDQLVGYFVGQASPGVSQTFREVSGAQDDYPEAAAELLASVCDAEGDWDRAVAAASDAVQADYDDYFETLESLGVNPKPVC